MDNETVWFVPVEESVLAFCAVKSTNAANLTREETKALMHWCDYQRESLWDDMSLQEILNVYRASAVWENFEAWEEEDPDAAREGWNSVVTPANRLRKNN